MEVVHEIEKVKTDTSDKPIFVQMMDTVTVDTFGVEYDAPKKA